MRKPFRMLLAVASAFLLASAPVLAAPYESYVYEKQTGNALRVPAAAVPETLLSGDTFQMSAWNNPSDLAVDAAGNLYVLDAGNSRVLCVDASLRALRFHLDGKREGGTDFTGAQGLFVNTQYLYIADTENHRILRYALEALQTQADTAVPEIILPSNLLVDTEKTPFRPLKLVVDNMERLFVVAEGMYEGMVELASDGKFLAYVGANRVTVNLFEQMWRLVATKKQWEAMEKFVPVEFSNVCLDAENFMFTTARGKTGNSQAIRRLNLNGTDVLRAHDETAELGDPKTVTQFVTRTEETYFVDVTAGPYELFAALDQTKGRVFVYDSRCTLLYEFGGLGTQIGTFTSPCALAWLPDNRIAVLDRRTGDVTVFRHTTYGETLLSTLAYEASGDYEKSAAAYEQILTLNANSEIAYIGVGKQLLRQKKYEEAMAYFKLGNDREYYSKAYEQHRKQTLGVAIPVIIVAIGVLILVLCCVAIFKKARWLRDNIRNIRQMPRK